MKRKMGIAIMAALLTMAVSVPAFAGYWYADRYEDWYYTNDDGTYPTNGWYWINEKCYYFKDNTICRNTITPDGYTVDETGAWTVNGVVQIKQGENLDYCKNISHFNDLEKSPIVLSKSVTDEGDYYDVLAEIHSSFPEEEGRILPRAVVHIRLRKTAKVHWYSYIDAAKLWTKTEKNLDEYANILGGNNPLTSVRMVDGIVQDSNGYVVEFSDFNGN